MENESWGSVFRQIRQMKNLSLAQVAGTDKNASRYIMSKQQVSRFELGQSDISLTKIADLLDNLDVSFEEYLYHVRNYQLPSGRALFEKLGQLQEKSDLAQIEQIYQQLQERYAQSQKPSDLWSALEYKAHLARKSYKDYAISQAELQDISDQLFSILEWSQVELYLFAELYDFLADNLVYEFAIELVKRTEFYRQIPENKALVVIIIRDCTHLFIEKGQVERAQQLLKSYERLIASPVVDVYNRKEFLFVKAKYLRLVGEEEAAAQIFKDLATVYEKLDYPETAQFVKSQIKKRHK
ncbi:Rgg/GadR/MutR family transcriptional regulator [Lactococcus kimchii]|uniref:Rgg/GadR/MutR family transcriptional regulator n=1 Tax=Lactococcus sp. S-13 TaxID=2507158 RepID=UPI001023F05D|nr:Rgg/GadR/MutR family transcriptional regulator [Lactococcus sp. S-13]RZI49928.1 Rgg/GadR/MutR family transcriptional regulator [Lactococcus sp. S-13]